MSEPTAPAAAANNNTPPFMDTTFVWARLYWEDKDKGTVKPAGEDPIKIRPVPKYVADLMKKAKDDDLKEELQRTGITQFSVYPPKSCANQEKYPAGKQLSEVMAELKGTPPTSPDHPLVVVSPAQNETNRPTAALAQVTLDAVLKIKDDETTNDWDDVAKKMKFCGRHSLTGEVKKFIEHLNGRVPEQKKEKCLVYSSVSGSGKTISFLQLKETLKPFALEKKIQIVVAYLGFNTRLALNHREQEHIHKNLVTGVADVLARRLVVSTIISMNNPGIVAKLPWRSDAYDRFTIPSQEESKKLLMDVTKASPRNPFVVVAGVDEVQMLNRIPTYELKEPQNKQPHKSEEEAKGDGNKSGGKAKQNGLGRQMLQLLRTWQREWHKDGLRIVPIGTGISLDWAHESTDGTLWDLGGEDSGEDVTLIRKEDFRKLVSDVVNSVDHYEDKVPMNTTKETCTELLAAAYWPRVRLLEWWRDGKPQLRSRNKDSQWKKWLEWMCHWLRVEWISIQETRLIPGKGDNVGNIHCLFEMKSDSEFTVIPDGYTWRDILEVLYEDLPVPNLYNHVDVVKGMQPSEFILGDCYEKERFGFHVISLAIHLGLCALWKATTKVVREGTASELQKKRLGLALWFQGRGVLFNLKGEMLQPILVGNSSTGSDHGSFYPFGDKHQTRLEKNFQGTLTRALQRHNQPVHVKCGRQTCCDYMYFYARVDLESGKRDFVALLVDAKHTAKDQGGGNSQPVTPNEQSGVYAAACRVHQAMSKVGLTLGAVRLVVLTNRSQVAETDSDFNFGVWKETAEDLFNAENLQLKIMNGPDTSEIEIGPLADMLWARCKISRKRKLEEVTEDL